MLLIHRLRMAIKPAALHFLCSVMVAIVVSLIIFLIWYPPPFDRLAGGRDLFLYIVIVDVLIGPLLTLLVYDAEKNRKSLIFDIRVIVVIQLLALTYGVYSAAQARPVFMAYEGNRYRVVSAPDIDRDAMVLASPEFNSLPMMGPKLLGVRLSESTDRDFPLSVQLSMSGLHSAFRPQRWVPYSSQLKEVRSALKTYESLLRRYPEKKSLLDASVSGCSKNLDEIGYLPISAEKANPLDWVAFVNVQTGMPCGFFPLDGW